MSSAFNCRFEVVGESSNVKICQLRLSTMSDRKKKLKRLRGLERHNQSSHTDLLIVPE